MPEDFVLWVVFVGVAAQDVGGYRSSERHEGTVAYDVCGTKLEGHSALLRTFKVARAT